MENNKTNIDLTFTSSIENIDFTVYDWLDISMNVSCNSKDGFNKVPVLWVTPERAFQVKNNKEFRDINGTLSVPLITLERSTIVKDQKLNGTYYANIFPNNNRQIISKRINQKKTSEFANADNKKKNGSVNFISPRQEKNKKIVYQFSNMLLPVYVQITYTINIFTQFQQQMNEIIQPFLTKTGSLRHFILEKNGYKYECFIEPNIDTKNNVSSMEEEERRYISTITLKVIGVVLSGGANEQDAVIKTYENPVELKFNREKLIIAKTEQIIPKDIVEQQGSNYGTQVYSNVLMKKVFLIGDNINSQYRVSHNFNTRDVLTIVRTNGGEDGTDFGRVEVAIDYSDLNHIDIDMGYIIDVNSYSVTVMG